MRALIPALFFLLAGWFLMDPLPGAPPVIATANVSAADLSIAPPRVRMQGKPTVVIGGVEQKCSDCHGIFPSAPTTPDQLLQHEHLVHDHGMNDRCFNCHSNDSRNRLILHDGSEVEFDQVERLCAKCHGTVYRDWQAGSHGRTHGSWDPSSEELWRLVCTDCHDPHSPAFKPMEPLPGPNTFRMGKVLTRATGHENRNVLRLHQGAHGAEDDH